MSEPHKNRSICVHWQIHYVKIVQMMAWEYFVVPLGTMYETYFLNCSLPYFAEFVIINNSHLEVAYHWQWKHSTFTCCENNRICQGKVKPRISWRNQLFKLQVLCHLHPFVHFQRQIHAHMSSLPNSRTKGIQVPGWKGAVVCTGQDSANDWKIMILGCTMALIQTLCSASLTLRLPKVPCLVLDRKNQQSTQPPA